jgi:hypothetical protein
MDKERYIMPITEISSSFAEVKEQYGKYGHGFVFDDAESATLDDLAKENATLLSENRASERRS